MFLILLKFMAVFDNTNDKQTFLFEVEKLSFEDKNIFNHRNY